MRYVYFALAFCLIVNCDGVEKQKETFCGVADPKNELIWLKKIIDIAETHQDINYIGAIYAEEYLGNDVIYVAMMLGSGGLPGHWFNCDGTDLIITPGNRPIATKENIIYKNY